MKTALKFVLLSALVLAGATVPLALLFPSAARAAFGCSAAGNVCPDQEDPPTCFQCPCPPGSGPLFDFGPAGLGPAFVGNGAGGCQLCGQANVHEAVLGMPSYWISKPCTNLRLEDFPLGYQPARGQPIQFVLSYRQRGAIVEDPGLFGVGTNWSCSFRAFLVDLTGSHPGLLRLHHGSAGYVDYDNGAMQYRDGSVVTSVTGGYQIVYPNGATNLFTTSFITGGNTCYALSSSIDPAGNAITYNYTNTGTVFRLASVVDPDGNPTLLFYENATFPNLITRVVDPFSRTNYLKYDSLGYLTNVVDVAGLSSSFNYDVGNPGWITNLITPYGATAFAFGGQDANNTDLCTVQSVNRSVTVTLPTGGHELYLYRLDCTNVLTSATYSPVPSTSPLPSTLDNVDQQARNSFHWDPLQYSLLTTTNPDYLVSADYAIGHLYHWLADPAASCNPSSTLSLERLPSPDRSTAGQLTWYDYAGKTSGNNYVGTNGQTSFVAVVLPDNTSTRYTYYSRNLYSLPTQTIETYSKPDGSIGYRTNNFYFSANDIDLLQQVGPNGEQVVSNYFSPGNTLHEPDATYDALDQQTTFTYNSYGQVVRISRPTGLSTINTYASAGANLNRLTNTTDLEINRTNSYTYYANGLVDTHTDERGLTTTSFWDNLQRLTGTAYPDGTASSNIYTILDLTATKDRLTNWTYFEYDALRHKIAETNANGVVTRYTYCDCGALTSMTEAWSIPGIQMITTFAYDYQGNRTNTSLTDASFTNWFNPLQQVSQSADGRGLRYYSYNNQGLLTNLSNAFGTERGTMFDNEDRPLYVTDANSVTVTNKYDLLSRLASRTYPDGGVEAFGYSARGLTAYTNQIGQTNFFAYDPAGRKTSQTNANGEVLLYTNDAAGDLLSLTDGKNQTTRWAYDPYGRVTNKIDQAGTVILTYAYDPDDRLTNRWSAAKGNTVYRFDRVGNLTNVAYPSSGTVKLQYDPLNRVTNMVDGVGTTTYTYTSGGQLQTETGPFASDSVSNTYVQHLRVALKLTQPTGTWTNGFTYDAAGRLINVLSQAGSSAYIYAPGRQTVPELVQLPNGAYITNTYDALARVLTNALRNGSGATLDSAVYGYNLAGQRTNFISAGTTVQYYYDNIGQLKIANSSAGGESSGYAYDSAWNLNWLTNSSGTTGFSVNSRDELTGIGGSLCTYDANGNLTQLGDAVSVGIVQFTYDDENRLTQAATNYNSAPEGPLIGQSVTNWKSIFVYDGLSRLRKRSEYGDGVLQTTTRYIYDGFRVIQERDGSNNPQVSYTRGTDLSGTLEGAGGIGGLLARSSGYSSGNPTSHAYYHADGNGNITCLQNIVATYNYDTYGNTSSSNGTLAAENLYRFSSKECHANSGMYYYGYRFYSPNLQRWINRDPMGEVAGINLYIFVGNNPINWVDALGLLLSDPEVAAIIFNETRSLSGDAAELSRMYQNLAHVIMNADAMQDASGGKYKRPKSAPAKCKPGPLDKSKYNQVLNDVRAARAAKEDPTDGALNFNLRPDSSTGNLFGAAYLPLSTQNGPFNNSFTSGGLPATGVFVNTYFDTRYMEP